MESPTTPSGSTRSCSFTSSSSSSSSDDDVKVGYHLYGSFEDTTDTELKADTSVLLNDKIKGELEKTCHDRQMSSSRRSDFKSETGTELRLACLALTCIIGSIYTMMRRYSQGILKEKYSINEVMVLAEFLKVVINLVMMYIQRRELGMERMGKQHQHQQNKLLSLSSDPNVDDVPVKASINGEHSLIYTISNSGEIVVLAVIYATCHVSNYIALRCIAAGMVTMASQCKILTTAFFSVIIVGRRYSAKKWLAMALLVVGVVWYSQPGLLDTHKKELRHSNNPIIGPNIVLLGYAAIIVGVILSGLGSVIFEKIVKIDSKQFTIWERNFQLAFVSIFVFLVFVAVEGGGPTGQVGTGWSMMAVLLALTASISGLVISMTLFHCNAELKCISSAMGVLLNSVLDHVLFGGPLTITMLFATMVVFLALYIYSSERTSSAVDDNNNKKSKWEKTRKNSFTGPYHRLSTPDVCNDSTQVSQPVCCKEPEVTAHELL